MDDATRILAMEWFDRGDHDLETARILFVNHGFGDSIALHIQQALEKYLKGYLVFHGKRPPKNHDLDYILHLVETISPDLSVYLELCERATKYYLENRYPPGPLIDYPVEIIRHDLNETIEMIGKIRNYLSI
jgi:HEPN domain-containing protein